MRPIPSVPSRLFAGFVLLLTSGATLAGAASRERDNDAPALCELRVSRETGTVALTALARADTIVSGRYALRVSGRGTDIRQDGPFRAAPGRPAILGRVALSAGAGFDAVLDLTVDNETVSCRKRVGGGI